MTEPITMKLELVPLAVADIDRALAFYRDQVGFHLDHDVQPAPGVRVTQLTPVGSGCSILLSTGLPDLADLPIGVARGLHLVVDDIHTVRAALVARGVAIADVIDMGGILYAGFSDPDGNTWVFQQIPSGR